MELLLFISIAVAFVFLLMWKKERQKAYKAEVQKAEREKERKAEQEEAREAEECIARLNQENTRLKQDKAELETENTRLKQLNTRLKHRQIPKETASQNRQQEGDYSRLYGTDSAWN